MSPTMQAVMPPPLGQEPVNTGTGPDGTVARVTATEVAGPPCTWTSMVQLAVLPLRILFWAACTLTHSCAVLAVSAVPDGLGDGVGLRGRSWHWEVATLLVVTSA